MSNVLHSCQKYFERSLLKVCQLNHFWYITANGVVHTLWNTQLQFNSAKKIRSLRNTIIKLQGDGDESKAREDSQFFLWSMIEVKWTSLSRVWLFAAPWKWQPIPVFLPGESQGRGSLVGCRLWVAQSRTRLKRLSRSSSRLYREGNGNPLQHSCLENPRHGGAWWAAVYGIAQSQTHDWSGLAAAAGQAISS